MSILNLDFSNPEIEPDLSNIELPNIVAISDFDYNSEPELQVSKSQFEQAKSKWREATSKRKLILAKLDYEVLQARKEMDSFR